MYMYNFYTLATVITINITFPCMYIRDIDKVLYNVATGVPDWLIRDGVSYRTETVKCWWTYAYQILAANYLGPTFQDISKENFVTFGKLTIIHQIPQHFIPPMLCHVQLAVSFIKV